METATWARRIGALAVDWFASTLVVLFAVGGYENWAGDQEAGFYVLGVFVVESTLFTALSGGSFGQVATRLRVVRENGDPRPLPLHLALVRQVLIAVVIPPLVYRPDGRGLHDVAAGSAVVTLQTFRSLTGRGSVQS
ncbi:RDD family protein [Nocardioides anomalus]|uniref:RDD family protein n=1 Tax=Nocardioides anomalus TaxID=2712223 RepID=A0A6G6WE90_9ACTN|nr:RDD family protein [Nocardioides anomalus]QIG43661.1 RDD family protein [Nocardioides anomalus]